MNSNEPNKSPLRPAELVPRIAVIGVIVGGLAISFLYVGGWLAPHALTPVAIVDTVEQVNGKHPGFRRNHA